MRKSIFVALITILSINDSLATIRKAGSGGHTLGLDYDSFDAVYLASAPGDTIYVFPGIEISVPSNGNYILKRLVVIGPGFFLDPDDPAYPGNAGLQVFKRTTFTSGIRLSSGSDGSEFFGCNFEISTEGSPVSFFTFGGGQVGNILFKRCRFKSVNNRFPALSLYSAGNNIRLQQCVFEGGISGSTVDNITVNNLTINNCLFVQPNGGKFLDFNIFNVPNNISGTISNCIFETPNIQSNLGNGTWLIQNCISRAVTFTGNAIAYLNNIGTETQFPSDNGNMQNTSWDTVFRLTGSWDGKYQLKPASPAIAASTDGTDCGIFGGGAPYKLSGIPPFPTIYALSSPQGPNPPGNTIQINISTRTNN